MKKEPANTLMFPVDPPFDAAFRNSSTETPVGPHCHDAAELYYTLTPLPDVLLEDKILAVPAGTLIIIPPFCVHQLYHEAGTVYKRYILSINAGWFESVFCNDPAVLPFLRRGSVPTLITPDRKESRRLMRYLGDLVSKIPRTSPDALANLFSCLSLIDAVTARTPGIPPARYPAPAAQQRVNDIISYIHDHIYENLTVNGLASRFYLNPDYMSRIFKTHVHICISRYIILQKTATAQSLLRDGLTVTQVQEKLGFSSYSYFFKTFSKIAGISPSLYRSQYRTGSQNPHEG